MLFTTNQLRDFSSLFSRSEVNQWLKNDFVSIDLKLNRYNLLEKYKGTSYLMILKRTYKLLVKHYPNEYVLKNEFLNQWLRNELGTENSIIFNEFRIGKAIADLVMFNGNSKVFEIKTILDKECRLSSQLQEYKKIFNEIYLIVPESLLSKYINYDITIGIITYKSESNNFFLVRSPETNCKIDVNVLMKILHTHEYLKISKDHFSNLPMMNSFTQFEICKDLISRIPSKELNKLFIKTMKQRKINNSFFKKINSEFNQICLSLNLKDTERDKLIMNLKSNVL